MSCHVVITSGDLAEIGCRVAGTGPVTEVQGSGSMTIPVALLIDGDALDHFATALAEARAGLEVVSARPEGAADGEE
ncbi:hypothetical protein GCM10027199_34950 [Amycolatopsis magusensis]